MLHRSPWKRIYFCLLLLLPFGGRGQEYILQYRALSVEDGLSSRFVRKVVQDQRGFIWIATSEGLNRYDGEKVLQYNKEQHRLPVNDINLLNEGPDGMLWVGERRPKDHNGVMGGGLKVSLFDPVSEKACTLEEYFGDKAPFREKELFGFYVDNNRRAWMSTYSGKAYLYDRGRFELLVDNKGAYPISYALPADAHSYWLLGPQALLRVDSAGRVLERDLITGHEGFPERIIPLANGGLLLQAFWYKKIKYKGRELSQQYRLAEGGTLDVSPYWKVQEGAGGWLWCFREDELHIFDAGGRLVAALSEKVPIPEEYAFHPPFAALTIDHDGLAWICPEKDILLLDVRENVFRNYLDEQGFSLRSLVPVGKDEIAVNSYKGLYRLNLSSGEAEPWFQKENLLGTGGIRTADGALWIALHGGKMARIRLEDNSLEQFPVVDQDGIGCEPFYPFMDRNKRLWVGTTEGVAVFDTASRQFIFDEDINRYLKGKACTWLCEGEEGLWVATGEGLFLISPGGKQINRISELPPFYIFHIYRESSSRFWLSTRGGGLIRWGRADGSFQQFTVENGLSSNIIYAAYPDEKGFLWMPSQNGLMRFDTASNTAQAFKELHGLPSNEFNSYAHLSLDDGRLLFGTIDGLASFSPKDIPARQGKGSVLNVLQAQQFDAKAGMMKDVTDKVAGRGFLEQTSRRRFAVFRFFLTDYFRPADNRYFYRIEGLDPGWQLIVENQLPIGLLPWGKYTLRVRAMSHDGYRAGNELAIPIYSVRPVYLRWWFILLLALAVSGLAILVFRWRLWQLRRSKLLLEAEVARRLQQIERDRRTIAEQKAHLEELNAAKDKLFSIIGHELRGPLMYFGNIGNRISHALGKKEYGQLGELGNKARSIAASTNNMLNNLLNWSLLESGRLSFGKGPSDVQDVIGQVMETYREAAGLKRLELDMDIAPDLYVQSGKDGLAILLQNLLSNAIKFTPEGGKVTVRASRQNGQAVIDVEDNGRGMPSEKLEQLFTAPFQSVSPGTEGERGTGLGLQIVQEILRRFDGKLEVESREGEGSRFTLVLPLAEGGEMAG